MMICKKIFFLFCIQFAIANAIAGTLSPFDNIKTNSQHIVEYRFVIAFSEPQERDTLWRVVSESVSAVSDSIVHFEPNQPYNAGYPFVPKSYARGLIRFFKKRFFYTSEYTTKIVIDSTNTYMCIWSFKTTSSGGLRKKAKGISKKIVERIISCLPSGTIVNLSQRPKRMTENHPNVAQIKYTGDRDFKKISIDSSCVNKIREWVASNYDFEPNSVTCLSTRDFKKAIDFRIEHTVSEDQPAPIDDRFVFVAINDSCGIDSVISSLDKKK